ncbi:MAG: cadherin-like beta sandwich domain-containing protein [Bacilli bacterium]|nr:cadherin-like beta sandwich domain-containing protein [Bacilli bacterium]
MKKLNIFLILIISLFIGINTVNAGASISVSSSKIEKGASVKATVKLTGVAAWNIRINSSGVTNGCSQSFADATGNGGNATKTFTVTCKSNSTGIINFTLSGDVTSADGKNTKVSASKSVQVVPPREKSNNNYLKSLSVEGFDLAPIFNKDTLEYSVTVPSTTNTIKINAEKENGYASIKGTGEFEVTDGVNNFEVVCTSETGIEKVYLLSVVVEDINPIEVNVNGEVLTVIKNSKNLVAPNNFNATTIKINDFDIPAFYNEVTKITLVALKNIDNEVSLYKYNNNKYEKYTEIISGNIQFTPSKITNTLEGYIKKDINVNNDKVEALVVSDNSKFAVLYGINIIDGKVGYYVYDMESKSIQKYDSEMIDLLRDENKEYLNLIYIAGGLAAISLLLVIILASSNSKKNKLIKKYLDKHENKNTNVKNVKLEETKVEVKEAKKDINEEIKEKKAKKNKQVSEELEATTYDIFADDKKKKRK